jgi:RNA polymerase sigma-70 factor (ECF subfamily)
LLAQRGVRPDAPPPDVVADETSEPLASDEPDPEAVALRASEQRKLDAAIGELPQEFREVLILREMEDMSYREIAEIVEAPIGTVMSRLARARGLLREKWLAEEPA